MDEGRNSKVEFILRFLLDHIVNNVYNTDMSRPREFDVDKVLVQSMEVFWDKGFKTTSFEDLTRKTNVKKQSLYGVFDDKRALFLKALALYRRQNQELLKELTSKDDTSVNILEAVKTATLHAVGEDSHRGCLMVNSALEFGSSDKEVTREIEFMFEDVQVVLEKVIQKGQEANEITKRFTSRQLAAHLANSLRGARIMEKSGAPTEYIKTALDTSFDLLKI